MIVDMIAKGFKRDDGQCIKKAKCCLDFFGVCHQRYYGGIGNHVHKILCVTMSYVGHTHSNYLFLPSSMEAHVYYQYYQQQPTQPN